MDPAELAALFAWFALGWCVLDTVVAARPEVTGVSTLQLWPEHFDLGTTVELGPGRG